LAEQINEQRQGKSAEQGLGPKDRANNTPAQDEQRNVQKQHGHSYRQSSQMENDCGQTADTAGGNFGRNEQIRYTDSCDNDTDQNPAVTQHNPFQHQPTSLP
jgi:hypothetical protein